MDQTDRTYTFAPRVGGATAVRVVVVGLGGTGYHLLQLLLGIFYALEDARAAAVPLPEHALGRLPLSLALVDPDTVEPKNVGRQKWRPADVGQFKAKAAAAYCARAYGIAAEYHVRLFADVPCIIGGEVVTVLVSCVDNAAARRLMHGLLDNRAATPQDRYGFGRWRERQFILVDCGNEQRTGQAFVGTTMDRARLAGAFSSVGLTSELPAAGLLDPGLLDGTTAPPRPPGADADDCAARVLRGEQAITINTHVAALATQLVTDLFLGELRVLGGFVDAGAGLKTTPVALTPRNVAGLLTGYTEDAYEMGLFHDAAAPRRAQRAMTGEPKRRAREPIPAAAIVAMGVAQDDVEAIGRADEMAGGVTVADLTPAMEAAPVEQTPLPMATPAPPVTSATSPAPGRAPRRRKKRRLRSHLADARAAGQALPRDGHRSAGDGPARQRPGGENRRPGHRHRRRSSSPDGDGGRRPLP